ncbi:aminopeptidase [Fulvivirga ulvae]|uniref:ABC transporter permease/M1 family aminopeptidase n=1 Tax=Fulvivirga ulvae TaxID=2904245 RepID=UPI001F307924|nr:M1 family aminopeptidase [Fulvivirga ulvae]UII31082.1 aminopeptidase [Fulvivirga ulvae]
MLYEIFRFEIQYRSRRPDTYIYFFILFFFSTIAVDFLFEGELHPLRRNAPLVIARTMGIVSALFMMVVSMIMGVAVLRDFDQQMESLMFVNPITKRDYLLGRFLGSFVVLVLIFSGLPLGMIAGDLMPWHKASELSPFELWHYLQPFLYLVLPTLFFGGAIFFVSGALSRKLIIVYTQGFFFLMAYLLAMNLAVKNDDLFVTALIEPFTFQTIRIATAFWTMAERNSMMVPMDDVLLYNRLMWSAIGIIALITGYYAFHFQVVRDKASRKRRQTTDSAASAPSHTGSTKEIPAVTVRTGTWIGLIQLLHHALFNFRFIIKSIPFWAIVLCGMCILVITPFNLGTVYGVDSYPTTDILVGELMENTILFFLAIILFYSGELVWQERDVRVNGIYDALPVSDTVNFTGKFIGLILSYVVLIAAMILAGIGYQTFSGYYQYEPGVYFMGFFGEIFPFLFFLTIISFFFQVLVNHKFLAHLVVVAFVFASSIMLQVIGFNHGLYTFAAGDLGTYSAMNGYGHFLEPYLWFKLYWLSFSILLFIVAIILSVRGTETRLFRRWKLSKPRFTKPLSRASGVSIIIFLLTGGFIFHNTNILNSYLPEPAQNALQADYEKTLQHYKNIPQPKIVDVNLHLDLFPYDRDYAVEGDYVLTNHHNQAINEIHIQKLPNDQVALEYLDIEGGATYNNKHELFSYYIYELKHPLYPGDSLKMTFRQTFTTTGFTENSDTHVVYNGTFFDNSHFPTVGYNEDIELDDDHIRSGLGLVPKVRSAKIDDPIAVLDGKAGGDGEEINFEMVISTDTSQTAIVPGYLKKEWQEGSRRYFHYKMDEPMSNFYSMVSARYEVLKDQWIPSNDGLGDTADLEIYYHKGHEYNLQRMMNGMKRSLDYYSKHFGQYQYRQLRILESTIYKNRAQSFPNTIPFSEGMGFILDINDQEDLDMAFYVTAHEVAHQWWGHQVNPANVQGMSMISETLAQYAALMVFKDAFPEAQVEQLLKLQRERYFKGRSRERSCEMPLALVESGQDYIHYGKGLINMYALQDYISEDSVNSALQQFLTDWNGFQKPLERYPTTDDLLKYFRRVTPDSLQYVIEDLFERITIYKLKTNEATYDRTNAGQYHVKLSLEAQKYRIDSSGSEEVLAINDWIDIGIYAGEELIYKKKHFMTNENTELEITVNRKPTRAGIDPLHKLIDRKPEDNLKTLLYE